MATDDPLRAAVLALLGTRPSATRRRQAAAQLRKLADEQEQLAAAEERQQQRPPAERLGRRRGGRPSTLWIRVERRPRRVGEADLLSVRLSRALYYAAGRPERLDVQRADGMLILVPAHGQVGYKIMASASAIHINASGARDIIALDDGRYAAEVRGGRIEVGGRLD